MASRNRFGRVASAQGATPASTFTIRVENISKGEVLKLSNGEVRAVRLRSGALGDSHRQRQSDLRRRASPTQARAWRQLAETGNPAPLAKSLRRRERHRAGGRRRPLRSARLPADRSLRGKGYEFEITAAPGQILSLAWMFGQSNDLFYSNERPIALFYRQRQAGCGRHDRAAVAVGCRNRSERGARARSQPGSPAEDAGCGNHASTRALHTYATGSRIRGPWMCSG